MESRFHRTQLAHRVDEALGFIAVAGLTMDHPIMKTTEFWTSHECLLLPCKQKIKLLTVEQHLLVEVIQALEGYDP